MPNTAILLAAGRGERIRRAAPDKILAPLAGRPAIRHSVEAFLASGSVETIVIVYRDEAQRHALRAALSDLEPADASPVTRFLWAQGGAERRDSVLSGLRALPAEPGLVFIHDAARPLVSAASIQRLARKAGATGAACLARRVTDTIKQAGQATELAPDACLLETVDRTRLWAMETPQVFDRALILAGYERAEAEGHFITDDSAALEASGHPVVLVENDQPNPKLTTASDLPFLEYLLSRGADS